MKLVLRGAGTTIVGVVLFAASQALAVSIPVTNPSFETPPLADGAAILAVTSWTIVGTSTGTFDPTIAFFPAGAPDGENITFINVFPGSIAQVLTSNLQLHTLYTLQVDVGRRVDKTIPPYEVQLLAGGVVLASESTVIPSVGTFSTVTVAFTTKGSHPQNGQPLEIRLVSPGGGSLDQVNFDNVRLSSVLLALAPAASHHVLIALLGLMMIVGVKRLRRSQG